MPALFAPWLRRWYDQGTSKPIDAIYEDGVFKPLTPPNLPEHTQAKVIPAPEPMEESDDEVSARRKAALLKTLD